MNRKVLESELEYDGDLKCLDGVPFSGTSFELFDQGAPKLESEYIDGLESGVCKEWFANGQLKSCVHCKNGMKHGISEIFFDNGHKQVNSLYEWGVEISYDEFTKKGELVISRKLDPNDENSNYKILEKLRRVYGA